MKYFISTNPALLQAAMDAPENLPSATVEAEFGSTLVTGSRMENGILVGNRTLAHHGVHSSNPVPCLHANEDLGLACIGLSHVDLDALGGAMALSGSKPEVEGFWELAAFMDLNGPHKLHAAGASDDNISRLYAWFAWSEANRLPRCKPDVVEDISEYVGLCCRVLDAILRGSAEYLAAGGRWLAT